MEHLLQSDTAKRKRSPEEYSVHVPELSPLQHGLEGPPGDLQIKSPVDLPLPKRLRLPPKPPTPESGLTPATSLTSLPPGIVQNIFSYLDPPSLGRLLCVNHFCRSLLDPAQTLPPTQVLECFYKGRDFRVKVLQPRLQNTIWTVSRRRSVPSMPKPMDGLSELQFFALAFGSLCQFCGLPSSSAVADSRPTWHPMPGESLVRIFWPFKVRSCAQCLASRLRKDADVMMSDASSLRPAMSFVFFTQAMHYVPQLLWRKSVPHNVDLQKYYYAPEIESLQDEAKSVQLLGPGVAEEWVKGLPSRGQMIQNFAAQCEEWEHNGSKALARKSLFPRSQDVKMLLLSTAPDTPSSHLPSHAAPVNTSLSMPFLHSLPAMPLQSYGSAPGTDSSRGPLPRPSDASSMGSQTSERRHKTAPSSTELKRARAYKKGEIVERCRALNPPINRDMLDRLDAFHNALQIPLPLNESSWDVLKSLLLRQRSQIELQDQARNSVTTAPTPGQFVAPYRSDEFVLAHGDVPVRERLCEIAREFVKQKFGHGAWVTFPTAPQFAAQVLVHTKDTYEQEMARTRQLRSQAGQGSADTKQDEILRYEHMKHVFDQVIKPQTENIRKDLFLCAECPPGGIVKYFPFDSMIQHFVFKHDPSFSAGAPTGFWKCEWPEVPPFNVHPERISTPEPSIIQTPTMSYRPLTGMSPGPIVNAGAPSGRRTPDTMSLLSGITNPFSVSGRSTGAYAQSYNAPGPAMYELQKDSLAIEIQRGWKLTTALPGVPSSLQLYLALSFAVKSFSKKYSNDPPLTLLEECINRKKEVNELKDVGLLRCAECLVNGHDESQVEWVLQDLIAHFRKMHVENNHSEVKLDWKESMISLPPPAFIKVLLSSHEMPIMIRDLLPDAETTAVIQKATTAQPAKQSIAAHHTMPYSQPPTDNRTTFTPITYVEPKYQPLSYQDHYRQSSNRLQLSTAATHGDLNSPRDVWSVSSHTIKAEDVSSLGSERLKFVSGGHHQYYAKTAMHPEIPVPSIETKFLPTSRGPVEPRSEAMSRSETLQSHHSRGAGIPKSTAEDFLSAIDATIDVEMAGSEPGDGRSLQASQPVSRTNSIRGPGMVIHHGASTEQDIIDSRRPSEANAANSYPQRSHLIARRVDHPVYANALDSAGSQSMERQPSRVIEFDRQGNPLINTSQVYQESSPPRNRTSRYYVDETGRSLEPISPSYGREFPTITQELPGMHYVEERYSRYPAAQIEYIPSQVYRPERIVDPITGQTYVAEHPSRRQIIEIGGPQLPHVEANRPAQYEYREVDYDTYRTANTRYERQPSSYQDRRYQER